MTAEYTPVVKEQEECLDRVWRHLDRVWRHLCHNLASCCCCALRAHQAHELDQIDAVGIPVVSTDAGSSESDCTATSLCSSTIAPGPCVIVAVGWSDCDLQEIYKWIAVQSVFSRPTRILEWERLNDGKHEDLKAASAIFLCWRADRGRVWSGFDDMYPQKTIKRLAKRCSGQLYVLLLMPKTMTQNKQHTLVRAESAAEGWEKGIYYVMEDESGIQSSLPLVQLP